jgi:hypothetical protein
MGVASGSGHRQVLAIIASNTAHASLKAAVAVVGPVGAFRVKDHRW